MFYPSFCTFDARIIIVENLLDTEETRLLFETAKRDQFLSQHSHDVKDASGKNSKLVLWAHPGDDIYGMIARSHKVVDRTEQLLGSEVYHYHSTMMLKEPKVGGAWEWHQDYGYWYDYGCLQVVKGSHRLGRMDHVEQTQAGSTQTSIDSEQIGSN